MASMQTEVVVVGGGMGGLVAAARALDEGIDELVLLEKGRRLGGSMAFSGGVIWTFSSYEKLRELAPDGKEDLQQLVFETIDNGFEWLEERGVEFHDLQVDIPGEGRQIEPESFIDTLTSDISSRGGTIMLDTPMSEILTDDNGTVTGVRARGSDGESITINAASVILATGGFQGNERLIQKYITGNPDRLWLRSNPWSTGDGLEKATDIGAKTTTGMSSFYGHNMAAPPAEFQPIHFREASQYYGPKAIAVDRSGNRYIDESISENEETLVQATVKEAGGRAYYIIDQDLYDSSFHAGSVGAVIERAEEFGARVLRADSIQKLGREIDKWGVDGEQVVETVRTFNEAIDKDRIDQLEPPRGRFHNAIDTPPLYAVEVQSGITFTMGGLDVTTSCEVLNRAESSSTLEYFPNHIRDIRITPIEGLYAAGADVGNIHNRRYLGGLAAALTTGLVAGKEAAQRA